MRGLLAVTCVLAMTGVSGAQTTFNVLKGTNDFELAIEEDDSTKACGIAATSVREAVVQPLSSTGLKVSPVDMAKLFDTSHLGLVVSLKTKHGIYLSPDDRLKPRQLHQDICVTNIQLMALANETISIKATGYKGGAMIVLWMENKLVEPSDVSTHKHGVEKGTRELAEKFAADWVSDNKPKESPGK